MLVPLIRRVVLIQLFMALAKIAKIETGNVVQELCWKRQEGKRVEPYEIYTENI